MSIPTTNISVKKFIAAERRNYPGDQDNLFWASCLQFSRYLDFLEIIVERQVGASIIAAKKTRDLLEKTRGPRVERISHQITADLSSSIILVQLETETFFIFANIYLDKVAQFIESYFGQQSGLSLSSHKNLRKNFARFYALSNLKIPKVFLDDIHWLEQTVKETRDKKITHQKNPRSIHATTFSKETSGSIVITHLYPRNTDSQSQTPGVEETTARLAEYTNRLIRIIKRNRKTSRFSVEAV